MALAFCQVCNVADDKQKCPKCGAHLEYGYGMMGGGMGAYSFCHNEDCDFFEKTQDEDEGPALPSEQGPPK